MKMSSIKKCTCSRDRQVKIDAKPMATVPSATLVAKELADEALIFAPPSTKEFTVVEADTDEKDVSVTSNTDAMDDIPPEEEAAETSDDDAGEEASTTDLEAFLEFQTLKLNAPIHQAPPPTIKQPVASPLVQTQRLHVHQAPSKFKGISMH